MCLIFLFSLAGSIHACYEEYNTSCQLLELARDVNSIYGPRQLAKKKQHQNRTDLSISVAYRRQWWSWNFVRYTTAVVVQFFIEFRLHI